MLCRSIDLITSQLGLTSTLLSCSTLSSSRTQRLCWRRASCSRSRRLRWGFLFLSTSGPVSFS